MQKTVLMAELLAERMYSRRYIWRIQKKIARHTAFFISRENLLRSDAWHALIIVTDSQSWMRTRNGKKKFFMAEKGWRRKGLPKYLVLATFPICQESQDLEVFCFLCCGFHVAWQWPNSKSVSFSLPTSYYGMAWWRWLCIPATTMTSMNVYNNVDKISQQNPNKT